MSLNSPTRLMRQAIALPLLAIFIASSGCTVCYNLRRNQCWEPRQFSWKRDHARSIELYSEWADEAWEEVGRASASSTSKNYRWGFHDGFVQMTYCGGNGEPPGAPPRPFWRVGWRTGSGKQAADEWFAGYRHGALVAREGGYREQAVIRSPVASAGWFPSSAAPMEGMNGSRHLHGPILEFPVEMRPETIEPGPDATDGPAIEGLDDPSSAEPGPLPPPEQLLDELGQRTSASDQSPAVVMPALAQDPWPEFGISSIARQPELEQRNVMPLHFDSIAPSSSAAGGELPRAGLPLQNPFR